MIKYAKHNFQKNDFSDLAQLQFIILIYKKCNVTMLIACL